MPCIWVMTAEGRDGGRRRGKGGKERGGGKKDSQPVRGVLKKGRDEKRDG